MQNGPIFFLHNLWCTIVPSRFSFLRILHLFLAATTTNVGFTNGRKSHRPFKYTVRVRFSNGLSPKIHFPHCCWFVVLLKSCSNVQIFLQQDRHVNVYTFFWWSQSTNYGMEFAFCWHKHIVLRPDKGCCRLKVFRCSGYIQNLYFFLQVTVKQGRLDNNDGMYLVSVISGLTVVSSFWEIFSATRASFSLARIFANCMPTSGINYQYSATFRK